MRKRAAGTHSMHSTHSTPYLSAPGSPGGKEERRNKRIKKLGMGESRFLKIKGILSPGRIGRTVVGGHESRAGASTSFSGRSVKLRRQVEGQHPHNASHRIPSHRRTRRNPCSHSHISVCRVLSTVQSIPRLYTPYVSVSFSPPDIHLHLHSHSHSHSYSQDCT